MTTCGALLIFVFVATAASILFSARRTRPRPQQPLSDSAGSAQFAQQREEARRRQHG